MPEIETSSGAAFRWRGVQITAHCTPIFRCVRFVCVFARIYAHVYGFGTDLKTGSELRQLVTAVFSSNQPARDLAAGSVRVVMYTSIRAVFAN